MKDFVRKYAPSRSLRGLGYALVLIFVLDVYLVILGGVALTFLPGGAPEQTASDCWAVGDSRESC